jgi:hypothetical protein
MVNFDDWVDNYIDILNIIYNEFLTISANKGINIKNCQESFDNFCYMIYSNSRNERLHNQNNYDYIN